MTLLLYHQSLSAFKDGGYSKYGLLHSYKSKVNLFIVERCSCRVCPPFACAYAATKCNLRLLASQGKIETRLSANNAYMYYDTKPIVK